MDSSDRAHPAVRLRFRPGDETWCGADARVGTCSVVFEDDGDTGYFYAVERIDGKDRILDALHVYDVHDLADGHIPSELEIAWTDDGLHALLTLNGRAHAVFDFGARRGWCRTGAPSAPSTGWSLQGHAWEDVALLPFV
jgi:hypothetical protein